MVDSNHNLTEAEAATWLRLKAQTLANWRSQGRGPAFSKIGARVVYRLSSLAAFVEANERTSTAART